MPSSSFGERESYTTQQSCCCSFFCCVLWNKCALVSLNRLVDRSCYNSLWHIMEQIDANDDENEFRIQRSATKLLPGMNKTILTQKIPNNSQLMMIIFEVNEWTKKWKKNGNLVIEHSDYLPVFVFSNQQFIKLNIILPRLSFNIDVFHKISWHTNLELVGIDSIVIRIWFFRTKGRSRNDTHFFLERLKIYFRDSIEKWKGGIFSGKMKTVSTEQMSENPCTWTEICSFVSGLIPFPLSWWH